MLLFLVLCTIVGLCSGGTLFGRGINQPDCSGRPNGVLYWACGGFEECRDGNYRQEDCVNGTVFDNNTQRCTDRAIAAFPCNMEDMDCSLYVNTPGHRMPLMVSDNQNNFGIRPCSFYYTCAYGRFLGFQGCQGGTVYDEGAQDCRFPNTVPAPCGDAPPSPQNGQGQGQQITIPLGQSQSNVNSPFGSGQGQGVFGRSNNNNQQQNEGNTNDNFNYNPPSGAGDNGGYGSSNSDFYQTGGGSYPGYYYRRYRY